MAHAIEDGIGAAREAYKRHEWQAAFELLKTADVAGELDAEGLRLLGKAADWSGDLGASIDAFERSHAAFIADGNSRRAAEVALMLRAEYLGNGDAAAADGCLRRAERLLVGLEDTVEFGYLSRIHGRRAFLAGKAEDGQRLLEAAIELGTRHGQPNLVAMSLGTLGVCLVEMGRVDEGFGHMDEACASAIGGQLGPFATGLLYCWTISAYRDAGEFDRAGEWTDTASRWCERHLITGFPGICRVHRAEFMRLRGAWTAAEAEARRAGEELESHRSAIAGDAFYEVGEIRLRTGDRDGAELAFDHAHRLYRDPQPGRAMLQALGGDAAGALRSLESALQNSGLGLLDRCRMLAVRVQLAIETGDMTLASGAVSELENLTEDRRGVGLRVLPVQARGELQVAQRDPAAIGTLHMALRLWREMDAPYEIGQVRLLLARAMTQAGDTGGAAREIDAALVCFRKLGAEPAIRRSEEIKAELAASVAPMTPLARCFMFTDIVGSTKLVDAIGDEAWAELVSWHDNSLRTCFANHGGEELDHAGDGFLVAFLDSASAFACAAAIQRNLAEHRRHHGFAPRVRIGLHASKAARLGKAFRGKGVHEAARIASLAEGDQVLASLESVPPGAKASEPRSVDIKGISHRIQVVLLDWR